MARALGFTQDITVCDHCGKSELKGTYAVEQNDSITYYGSICISKAFGKVQGKTLKERAKIVAMLATCHRRSERALHWFGWGTKEGWIIDGIGQRVIEVA
jgi:hypothetical protein